MGLELGYVLTFKENPPLFRMIKTIDTIEQTGLTCPIGPNDGKYLTLFNPDTDAIKGLQAPEGKVNVFHPELIFLLILHVSVLFQGFYLSDFDNGLHAKSLSVLVTDIRFHLQLLLVPVKGRDQVFIPLCNKAPPYLSYPGQFIVVRV
jgi:hypothetical protein